MIELDYMIVGLCCQLYKKHEASGCPVKEASPWSRWANFCNEFRDIDDGSTILDILTKKLRGISLNKNPDGRLIRRGK